MFDRIRSLIVSQLRVMQDPAVLTDITVVHSNLEVWLAPAQVRRNRARPHQFVPVVAHSATLPSASFISKHKIHASSLAFPCLAKMTAR